MRLDSQPYFLAHTKYLEATFPHRVQITVIKCENMFTAAVNFTACKIRTAVGHSSQSVQPEREG